MTNFLPVVGAITPLDYCTFGLYLALSVFLGISCGGKQKDLKTYLLAGNQMHWGMIAISVLAALFSGISFLGAPAETFQHNLIYLWVIIGYFVATPITTIVFLPFFYRLNLFTAYEYLERRFDIRLRRLSSASFIFRASLWLALALYAPSLVIAEMADIPIWIAVVATGGVTLFYTAFGGMRAVIYTDVMQFSVLMAGIIAILVVALLKIPGGVEGAWEIARLGGRTQFVDWSFDPTVRMTFWGGFIGGVFTNLVGLITDQVSVQRYLTASSLKDSQRALWCKLFLTLPLVGVFYFTGLVLYSFYQVHPGFGADLSSPDQILPIFVNQQLSAPFPGLLVAAILAATMSTVSAGINSLTAATLMDFFYTDRKVTEALDESVKVRTARIWTVGYGVIVILLALVVSRLGTFIEASNKISGFFGGPLLGIFFLGVLSRRANAKGTLLGAVVGFLAVVISGLFTSVSFMWYAAIGCVVTYGVGRIASRFSDPPTVSQKSLSFFGQTQPPLSESIPPRSIQPAGQPSSE